MTMARGFDFLSNHFEYNEAEEDAVGMLLKLYPAMSELNERNPVFEDILVFAGLRVASCHKQRAAFRLVFGALLSISDKFTDFFMIYEFYSVGELGFASAIAISLLSNITLQLLTVFILYRKMSLCRLLKEMAFVVTFTKAGVDAYRVVKDEHEVGVIMYPTTEMVFTKASKLLSEAIPGTLIQTYAILTGSKVDNASAMMFSLVISILAASYTSTAMSFDLDIDKHKRSHTAGFYGFVPDDPKKKVIVFLCMLLTSI